MSALRLVLCASLLTGCNTVPRAPEPAPQPDTAPSEVTPARAPESRGSATPRCTRINRDWLLQLAPAEGSALQCFSVAKARRGQIEQLDRQLAAIAAALAKGCIE